MIFHKNGQHWLMLVNRVLFLVINTYNENLGQWVSLTQANQVGWWQCCLLSPRHPSLPVWCLESQAYINSISSMVISIMLAMVLHNCQSYCIITVITSIWLLPVWSMTPLRGIFKQHIYLLWLFLVNVIVVYGCYWSHILIDHQLAWSQLCLEHCHIDHLTRQAKGSEVRFTATTGWWLSVTIFTFISVNQPQVHKK